MTDEKKMPNKKKTPANENPWYVLATLAGEQTGDTFDEKIHNKNQQFWNAWACQELTDEEKAEINKKADRNVLEYVPKWDSVEAEAKELFQNRVPDLDLPAPSESIYFYDFKFTTHVFFDGFIFPSSAIFVNATFTNGAHFMFTTFTDDAFFERAIFTDGAYFESAAFTGITSFENATFTDSAYFESATFTGIASFESARFTNNAFFAGVTFTDDAFFARATFTDGADFENATFSEMAYFQLCTFEGHSVFIDARFRAPTNFRDAKFKKAYPRFEGMSLHDKTNVTAEDENWPAGDQIDDKAAQKICAHLRHNMAQQGLHDAAHFFFRREMYHKMKGARFWEKLFYKPYKWFEFGYGVGQPVLLLIGLWLIGVAAFLHECKFIWYQAMGLSFSNIFRFFGLQAAYFSSNSDELGAWLNFLGGAQTVLGYIILFFLVLGLRNRFRLR